MDIWRIRLCAVVTVALDQIVPVCYEPIAVQAVLLPMAIHQKRFK